MKEMFLDLLHRDANESAWRDFHEASKTSRLDAPKPNAIVREKMHGMWPSLPYSGYPEISLEPPQPIDASLSQAILARQTGRKLQSCNLSLQQVSQILHYSYGETRDETDSGFPRPFRVIPSGGAMYPLDIFIHSSRIAGVKGGIYHYNPSRHTLRLVIDGDQSRGISAGLVQPELALESAMTVFVTMMPERSVFKYDERGYRFCLLEAGHLAQNLNLVATALNLAVVNIGGFFDHEIDHLLRMDGMMQCTIYMMAVGAEGTEEWVGH